MATSKSDPPTSPPGKHPIRVVSQRTGLKADLIRAWERRYGAIKPQRSAGRHRFYSDDDIERLLLLRQATSSARSISQLAQLDNEELAQLIEEDRAAQLGAPPEAGAPLTAGVGTGAATLGAGAATLPPATAAVEPPRTEPSAHGRSPVDAALDAVVRLDSPALAAHLSQATLQLGYSQTLIELVEPLLAAVEKLKGEGRLRDMHHGFAGCEIRAFVETLMRRAPLDVGAPKAVVATPRGQRQELGALVAAAHAAGEGWQIVYLGANLEAAEIAAACQSTGALAVILDLSFPKDDPALGPQLWELRRLLGPGRPLLVGGPALDGYVQYLHSRPSFGDREVPDAMASAIPVQTPGELKTLLIQLRARSAATVEVVGSTPPRETGGETPPTLGIRELPLAAQARREWGLDASLVTENGALRVGSLRAVRRLVHRLNQSAAIQAGEEPSFFAGQIKGASLVYELAGRVLHRRLQQEGDALLDQLLDTVRFRVQGSGGLLRHFAELFPQNRLGVVDPRGRGPTDGQLLIRLFLLQQLSRNPACKNVKRLFDDSRLASSPAYEEVRTCLEEALAGRPGSTAAHNLYEELSVARDSAPDSLAEQLELWLKHHPRLTEDLEDRLWICLDVLHEEEAPPSEELRRQRPPRPIDLTLEPTDPLGGPISGGSKSPARRRRPDKPWMHGLVLQAKNVLVWLHQLSAAYDRPVRTLDQIPDEELDRLADLGVTGLWLVGIWTRSRASRKIKQLLGRQDAVASAYAIDAYEPAAELGGEAAKKDLERRAAERGIRLACDMVPNHTGIDSRWVLEYPERFVQVKERPFPSYTFDGTDLSSDPRIALYLEDHYEDQSDAAVVFQRVDRETGEVRFLYHGNDGTSLPWNDTAQLDYSREDVRDALVEQILRLAKEYPILRLDAAMTLIREHFQRLWYPEPGKGGAVPSRAEHHMTREQFHQRMPRELWREVLDRIEQEAPETLLVAEGFWYTESYFVRELGMHRVYNSAFLHLLKEGQSAQLLDGLKKTLAVDPSALDCFVNFLTNPDEATAAAHFGTGDRYFAFATLLVTLPGLPLLGHGQIEGMKEQYPMDAERPKEDEAADPEVVELHHRRIVPLLKERPLYAKGRSFRLFEVDGSDTLVAFVNGDGDAKRLVLVNNGDASTVGTVLRGVPFLDGDELRSENLARALDAPREGRLTLREIRDDRTFEVDAGQLDRQGLRVELEPWETRVLELIRPEG